MSRVRSAASGRTNTTGMSVRSGRTNRSKITNTSASTVLEYPCNPCMRVNINEEATNYCQDCGDNLCAECVKQHMKFAAMKGHKILGKSERRSSSGIAHVPKNNPLECTEHPGKMADMFCADHNEVWCGACIALSHRYILHFIFLAQLLICCFVILIVHLFCNTTLNNVQWST